MLIQTKFGGCPPTIYMVDDQNRASDYEYLLFTRKVKSDFELKQAVVAGFLFSTSLFDLFGEIKPILKK